MVLAYLGVFMVRLIGPLTYTTDRTEHFNLLNFGTRLDQETIEDRTVPGRIVWAGLGRSTLSRRKKLAFFIKLELHNQNQT